MKNFIAFFFGIILGGIIIFFSTEYKITHMQTNIKGCEVISKQCLSDLMEAQYYFNACFQKLEECTGKNK